MVLDRFGQIDYYGVILECGRDLTTPHLKAREGLILNIADIHGQRPLRYHTVYSPAKAGLIMLTQSLARELAPQVRVNAIAPGPVEFPEHGLTDEMKQVIIDKTLLKRRGTPEDIAGLDGAIAREAVRGDRDPC